MAKLKIKRDDLVDALTFHADVSDHVNYLDTETGEILLVGDGVEEEVPEDIEEDPRYLRIEPIESRESFRIMEDFLETVTHDRAAARLRRALDGRKPFRRFKDELFDFPDLRSAWFAFQQAAHERLAEEWCSENNIEVEWRHERAPDAM